MANQHLFSEFPEISKQEWLDKISSELKNQTIEDLTWKLDNLNVSPFAHKDDFIKHPTPIIQQLDNEWGIGEDFYIHDLKKSNLKILDALMNGVNCPNFTFSSAPNSRDLDILFKDIDLSMISIFFNGNAIQNKPIQTATTIKEWWTKNYPNDKMKGGFRYSKSLDFTILKTLLDIFKDDQVTIFSIDTQSFYTGKEFVIDELKLMILDATQFIEALKDDFDLNFLIKKIEIPFAIDPSYFLNIAKIRAFKILWANVMKAFGTKKIELPFLSAFFAASVYDELDYTNMIRATTMSMSAVIGGIDLLTISPSNLNDKVFAKRIARNLHHILMMESHFDHVVDPASGSYYIENLTNQICKIVWEELSKL